MAHERIPLPATRPAALAPLIVSVMGAVMAAVLGATVPSVTLECSRQPGGAARCVGLEQTWLGPGEAGPITFDPGQFVVELDPSLKGGSLTLRSAQGPLPFARSLAGADAVDLKRGIEAFAHGNEASLRLRGGFSLRPFFFLVPALALLLALPGMNQRGQVEIERGPASLRVRRRRQLGSTSEAELPLDAGEAPRLDIRPVGHPGHRVGQLWATSSKGKALLLDLVPLDPLRVVAERIETLYSGGAA